MPYTFLTDVAIADVAFEARGKKLSELFRSCALATIESIANPKTVKARKQIVIELSEETIERLLFSFLEEIIFIKDRDAMVFSDVNVTVNEKKKTLTATLHGDDIRPDTQELHQDVKAVTMHYFTVQKLKNNWKANVVLDI